ncbi:MAG: GatB/YqeY domain-containing protein, partial [Candidatus Krumholzibacteria bacterium]|nr:GatB/YqeY domain-containing protein [Candidatus Krumholzibacteria bacterium]
MIIEKLSEDMKAALKAGDKPRLGVVRMLISELKNARIAAGAELDEGAEQKVLASYAKKRKEAIDAARDGGRQDIAEREKFEYDVTMSYLPEQLDDEALRALARQQVEKLGASGPQAFGAVMKAVMAEVGGRADGKAVSAVVRELLS